MKSKIKNPISFVFGNRILDLVDAILISGFALSMSGCSTTTKLTLQSNPPKASIYLRSASSAGEGKLVGETPLTLDGEKVPADVKAGPVFLEIRKEGFRTSEILITELMGLSTTINRELEAEKKPEAKADGETKKNDIVDISPVVDELFEAQRLVRVGRLDEALKVLSTVRTQHPSLAAVYEMQGGVFYLQKKLTDSLDAFRLAQKFNPQNYESTRMVAILENMLGVQRAPAKAASTEVPEQLSKPDEGTNKQPELNKPDGQAGAKDQPSATN